MRHFRFSIAGLMGAVLVAAVGLAALLSASPIWAGTMLLLTYVVLGLAILCAVLRGHARRAWWLGFCVFGWGYLALERVGAGPNPIEPLTTVMLEELGLWLDGPVLHNGGVAWRSPLNPWYEQNGYCLCALLAAVAGGILGRLCFAAPADRSASGETVPRRPVRPPGRGGPG